jgi:hypothetical protein
VKFRFAAFLAFAVFSLNSFAGDYDGIWLRNNGTDNTYRIWYSTGTTWISVAVVPTTGLYGTWNTTSIGTIAGNTITGVWDNETTKGSFTITLSSLTSGDLVYKTCSPKTGVPATVCPTLNSSNLLSKML